VFEEVGQTIPSVGNRMEAKVSNERVFHGQSLDIAEVIEDERLLLMSRLPNDHLGAGSRGEHDGGCCGYRQNRTEL
jgi:hypothetical protein